jgi:RHS repeat-associated protein
VYFLPNDHCCASSLSVTVNSDGTLKSELRYSAFGEERLSSGTTPSDNRYTGQLSKMASIGLYFYQSRWYDPYLNHWTQPDSIIPDSYNPQDWDRYAYVHNDPINHNDPTGHDVGCSAADPKCKDQNTFTAKDQEALYKAQYNAWNSSRYSGCFKCHAAVANSQIALTGWQLENAHQNMQEWQAVGYTPLVATTGVVGGAELLSTAPALVGTSGATGTTACVQGNCTDEIGSTGDIGEQLLLQAGGKSQQYFPTTLGKRFIDQVVNGMAYESKVGYVSLTEKISIQVSKDAELLMNGNVKSVTWVFFKSPITGLGGPSGPLYQLLEQNYIKVLYGQQ